MTTMRGLRRLVILFTVALIVSALGACAAPRTATDYDPGVDFAKYRTYQWIPADAVGLTGPEDPRVSPVARERMRAAIDQAMLAKGYVRTTPFDFFIALRTDMRDRQYVDHWGPHADPWLWRPGYRHRSFGAFGYYGPFGYDPFFSRAMLRTVTEGTIAVNMFDAETKRPIWHGHAIRVVARDDIHPADIQRMVNAVLADFPPGPPHMAGLRGISPSPR